MITPSVPLHRRTFIKSVLALGAAPGVLPARLVAAGNPAKPSRQITIGVLGVGAQGKSDLRAFLAQPDVRVTAVCDVNQRNLASARQIIREAYGKDEVRHTGTSGS